MGLEQFSKFGTGISGIAGAGMSLIGGIGGAIQGRKNRKLARQLQQQQLDWQRAENERAFQRDIEMWNMQNAYNSPAAHMQRLVEAGLNPNLALGDLGSTFANNAPSYNAADVPSVSDAAFANPYDSVTAAGAQMTQASATLSQASLNRANEKKVTAETVGEVIRNNNLPKTIELTLNNLSQDFENKKEMLEVIKNNANMLGKQTKLFEVQANKVNAEADKVRKEIEGLDVENFIRKATRDDRIREIQAQARITDEQARTIAERIAIEIKHGHLAIQGLEKELVVMAWEVSMREAGLPIEFQNRMNRLLKEGHEVDAGEKMAQALREIAPEQARRVVSHYGSFLGDFTYFASEVAVPLLHLVPKFSSSKTFKSQSQDRYGNFSSSSGSSSTSFGGW